MNLIVTKRMTSESRRKAAKSLTTLFDKAAIQRLNKQSETVSDHLHHYFNSVSSHFKPSSLTAPRKQQRRHSEKVRRCTQSTLNHDHYKFSEQDASDSENIRWSQGRHMVMELVSNRTDHPTSKQTETSEKWCLTSTRKLIALHHDRDDENGSLQPLNKRPRTEKSKHVNLLPKDKIPKQPNQLEKTSAKPLKKQSISNKKSRKKPVGMDPSNVTTNKRPCAESHTPVFETAIKETLSMSPEKSSKQRQANNFFALGDRGNLTYDGWHVVRKQVGMLREPVMFGGIVKHKFEALSKAHDRATGCTDEHMHDGVIAQAMKRYNKKLLAYHHQHSESSENKQRRAVAVLSKFHQINDSNSTKAHWKHAACDLNFDFPHEIPTQFEASRSQYDNYAALAASIDRLQKERKRKHAVLKSMLQVVTDLDHVKKADDRYMAEACSSYLVARHHAAQMCAASNDAQAVVSILLKNAMDDDNDR